ncbi:MAG: methylenetetrahydrofolate reductase [NAD(P)H], partial [Spirochaetales bacterium]
QTHELVRRVNAETWIHAVPHLTCVCHSQREIDQILDDYAQINIGAIMALGGDPPGNGAADCRPEFPHAIDLVRAISAFNASGRHPSPDGFGIGVAGFPEGHPATPNRKQEMDYLKEKVDAGADYICTQLFFDNRDFLDFRDRCVLAGITIPIVAGVMPIANRGNYERIPSLALGARYPAALIRRFDGMEGDDEVENAGIEWAIDQCAGLVREGVNGIHLYTLNKFRVVKTIWDAIDPR